ncbi:MAG: 50S ribosomal protein L9 [Chloroflexota bacterium]|nr:50S ribosomal protein L9 [Chloroflexota bacterium]
MRVVFLEDVQGTARIGEIKDVKPGFARNYLLPRKLAMPATPAVVKSAEQRAHREARLEEGRDTDARAVAGRLDGAAYTIQAKAGASGKLFGSVGTSDIAAKVAETIGMEFERQNVLLAEPIKELGDYSIEVKLTRNVGATVTVSVVGEDGTTAADLKAKARGGTKASAAAQTDEADDVADEGIDSESEVDEELAGEDE